MVDGTDVQLYIGQATYKVGTSTQDPAWQDPNEEAWTDTSAEPGQRYTYYATALDRAYRESARSRPSTVR